MNWSPSDQIDALTLRPQKSGMRSDRRTLAKFPAERPAPGARLDGGGVARGLSTLRDCLRRRSAARLHDLLTVVPDVRHLRFLEDVRSFVGERRSHTR